LPTARHTSPTRTRSESPRNKTRQIRCVDLQNGQVAARIGADQLSGVGLLFASSTFDLLGAVDYVVIGQNIAVAVTITPDPSPRWSGGFTSTRPWRPLAEETKKWINGKGELF
jgi:hypothetical protein